MPVSGWRSTWCRGSSRAGVPQAPQREPRQRRHRPGTEGLVGLVADVLQQHAACAAAAHFQPQSWARSGGPPEVWTRFRLALRGRHDWDERLAALAAVRAACPGFLAGEPDLRATRAWMRATGG